MHPAGFYLNDGKGLLLKGNGNGHFSVVPIQRSGLFVNEEIRDIKRIKT